MYGFPSTSTRCRLESITSRVEGDAKAHVRDSAVRPSVCPIKSGTAITTDLIILREFFSFARVTCTAFSIRRVKGQVTRCGFIFESSSSSSSSSSFPFIFQVDTRNLNYSELQIMRRLLLLYVKGVAISRLSIYHTEGRIFPVN